MTQQPAVSDSRHSHLRERGYDVHHGQPSDGELAGRYWWTLHRAGWSGIETAEGDFASEDEAWQDAARNDAEDLDDADQAAQ